MQVVQDSAHLLALKDQEHHAETLGMHLTLLSLQRAQSHIQVLQVMSHELLLI